jgi:hypothetical protein
MDTDSPEALNYLAELYQRTAGDVSVQVSMYEVGAAVDMEKTLAGKLAEDLIGDGLVEVKTLSGGIGITALGIEQVQAAGLAGGGADAPVVLGDSPLLEGENKAAVVSLVREIKSAAAQKSGSYDSLEEMVIDIKTLEVQLLSPRPKTAIVREVLLSMGQTLKSIGQHDLSDTIGKMTKA